MPRQETELLQIGIMERQRKLVRRDDVNELIDAMCCTVLTHLSGMAARCSRDRLRVRRNIDAVCDADRGARIARLVLPRRMSGTSRRSMSWTDPRPGQVLRDVALSEICAAGRVSRSQKSFKEPPAFHFWGPQTGTA